MTATRKKCLRKSPKSESGSSTKTPKRGERRRHLQSKKRHSINEAYEGANPSNSFVASRNHHPNKVLKKKHKSSSSSASSSNNDLVWLMSFPK